MRNVSLLTFTSKLRTLLRSFTFVKCEYFFINKLSVNFLQNDPHVTFILLFKFTLFLFSIHNTKPHLSIYKTAHYIFCTEYFFDFLLPATSKKFDRITAVFIDIHMFLYSKI